MRYFRVQMLRKVNNGQDVLGNPTGTLEASDEHYRGGFTVWTAEDVQILGRDVTKTQQKMITDAPLSVCLAAAGVRTERGDFRILSVSDLNGRWRLLVVEQWRSKKCGSN